LALSNNLRRLLPIAVSAAIIAFAARELIGTLHRLNVHDVLAALQRIDPAEVVVGAVLVCVLYAALSTCEVAIARFVNGPVSPRRAVLGAMLAAPIGHAVGWGAVSGGAIRYRIYSAVLTRPLDIGKMVLLASIPYPAGLGLLLGASLVLQSGAAATILHVSADLARGTGLALLALHAIYLTLILKRRRPFDFGRFILVLPPPRLTAVQYLVGIIEVFCGAGVLYVLLPHGIGLPFVVFLGVYVLCILAAIASSVPAGIGVFEAVLLGLLPHIAPAELLGSVLAYRFVLELVPLLIALVLFASYELWWRLPAQRARLARLRAAEVCDED